MILELVPSSFTPLGTKLQWRRAPGQLLSQAAQVPLQAPVASADLPLAGRQGLYRLKMGP
jgi:hypothetical protein